MTVPTVHEPTSPLPASHASDFAPVATDAAKVSRWFRWEAGYVVVRIVFEGLSAGGGVGERWLGEQELQDMCGGRFEMWLGAEKRVCLVRERRSYRLGQCVLGGGGRLFVWSSGRVEVHWLGSGWNEDRCRG